MLYVVPHTYELFAMAFLILMTFVFPEHRFKINTFSIFSPPNCQGGNSDSVFHVDKTVGTIIIAKPLDAEQQPFYNLTVQATDGTKTTHTQVPRSF